MNFPTLLEEIDLHVDSAHRSRVFADGDRPSTPPWIRIDFGPFDTFAGAIEIVKKLNALISARELESCHIQIDWDDQRAGGSRFWQASVSFAWFGCSDHGWEGEIVNLRDHRKE